MFEYGPNGGLEGIRTLDPHNANVVRSQLRYKPIGCGINRSLDYTLPERICQVQTYRRMAYSTGVSAGSSSSSGCASSSRTSATVPE